MCSEKARLWRAGWRRAPPAPASRGQPLPPRKALWAEREVWRQPTPRQNGTHLAELTDLRFLLSPPHGAGNSAGCRMGEPCKIRAKWKGRRVLFLGDLLVSLTATTVHSAYAL